MKDISIIGILILVISGVIGFKFFSGDYDPKYELDIIKENSSCGEGIFTLRDKYKIKFTSDSKLEVTNLNLWVSECKSLDIIDCSTPYFKEEKTVFPDWYGFQNNEYNNINMLFSRTGFYAISILSGNKLLAHKTIEIVKRCK